MHEPLYSNLVKKATAFLESSGPSPKKDEISAKLDDVNKRWDALKTKTNERYAQIEDVLPLAQKYHDNSQNVKDVVNLAEIELGSYLGVSPDVEIAKKELQNIKVWYKGPHHVVCVPFRKGSVRRLANDEQYLPKTMENNYCTITIITNIPMKINFVLLMDRICILGIVTSLQGRLMRGNIIKRDC